MYMYIYIYIIYYIYTHRHKIINIYSTPRKYSSSKYEQDINDFIRRTKLTAHFKRTQSLASITFSSKQILLNNFVLDPKRNPQHCRNVYISIQKGIKN